MNFQRSMDHLRRSVSATRGASSIYAARPFLVELAEASCCIGEPCPSPFVRLWRYVTVADAGAAVGPLVGSWLADTPAGLGAAYPVAAAVFLGLALFFARAGAAGPEFLVDRAA